MKVVLQKKKRARVMFGLLLACALHVQVPLQAQKKVASAVTNHPTSKLGEVKVDIRSLQPSRLLNALRSNIFTDVTLDIAGQPRTFRVSVSSKVTILNGGESVYDGPDQSDPNNKIFMLLSEQRSDITITLGDREYLIAPTENADDKSSTQKGGALPGVTTFGAYSLIDRHELGKWITDNAPAGRFADKTLLTCGTDMLTKKNDATAKNWNYESKRIGYIGKRDLYLHVYGAINQDRFPTFVNNMNKIFTHDNFDFFNDIRLVVIKHARGETDNQIIDDNNLPWNNDAQDFLRTFSGKVNSSVYPNEYYMYLSDKKWDGVYGIADSEPGRHSIAVYSVSVPYQVGYTVPLHEFSHNLGAQHTNDTYYANGLIYADLMKSRGFWDYFYGPILDWHYNAMNRGRIQMQVDAVSIKDEILDGTYTPTVRDWYLSEDLVTVLGDTDNTSIVPTPPDTDKPFDDGGPDVSKQNRWKINVYKMKVPRHGARDQLFLQIRITEADFDTFLYVLDENGNLVAKDDDSGRGIGSARFFVDNPGKSYLSGYFNANKYYYIIVGGFNPSSYSGGATVFNGDGGRFELKIRYGWSTEGWLTPRNLNSRQVSGLGALPTTDAPDKSQMLMAKDGSFISVADFGVNDKALTPEVAPQLSLNVYPNPVKDGVLHIQQDGLTTNDSYSLFNSEGKVVQEGKLQPSDKNGLSIKLLPSTKGLLVLRIRSIADGSVRTAKIVVE